MALRSPVRQFHDSRRRWLIQAGALASSTALPLWVARAGAESQSTLNALPRIALIIGNTKYPDAPLKNPGNDARAIAGELQKVGFKVNLQLDTGRMQLADAIQAFGADLAKTKGVVLFYYAGHGAQLGWRNYLIPVDADVEKLEDMRTKTVELNTLLAGLTKAQNAMNVIILDACRDNPFGTKVPTEHKGLSQFDAPPGSLLAYATSPGNTAGDGEGANGLYTEYLLREIKVPEAKIEDVLKRVRLNVRRKSEGQQIPWESTSLEEDFYFLPPQQIKKLSEAELEKKFDEELKLWEGAKAARAAAPLEDYLRRYPNGEFAELAQLELDYVLAKQGEKRIEVQSQAGNPFTQGFARANTDFKVGDFYSYRVLDLESKSEKHVLRGEVTSVNGDEVTFDKGQVVLDRMGNTRRNSQGFRFSDNQNMPLEFSVGKKWTTQYRTYPPNIPAHIRVMSEVVYKIAGRDKIQVPAGVFECFRVEGRGQGSSPKGNVIVSSVTWWAPELVRRFVAQEHTREPPTGSSVPASHERMELLEFKQS
ncbi:MAG: caspase family protein [Betaproteobacteria bacterium]|nr:caspase family protein [Betaproteobacteria bacterium]